MFLDDVDAEQARGEVQDLVDQVRRELPVGREIQPVVTDIDFESAPIMLVNLSGPPGYDERALKQLAEEVQKELEAIPGVANTQIYGGREREIHIDVDADLASEYGLTINDIRAAVARFHAPIPGGTTNTGGIDENIRNETQLRGVEDIEEIEVPRQGASSVRISDFATVTDTYRRRLNVALLDGRPCATIIVNKEADINTLQAAQDIKARVVDLEKEYPHIRFSTTRDTSQEISIMFRVLGSSFVFGAMLVLLILTWTMGLRISILVLLAIPFSSAIGLIFLYAAGIPLSNMVIFSFILVLGMVVDGAIIVAENIHRHVERGEDPDTAARLGIEEVGMPVIMADLTTIAAYLPMLLVPGIMGDFMSVLPKVVSMSLAGSIMVDHFLIPVIAARWYRKHEVKGDAKATLHETLGESDRVEVSAEGETRIRPNLGFITRGYASVLRWSLLNRWAVVTCVMLCLVWSAFMFQNIGFEFFPPSDRGQFEIKYELPLGSSIDQTYAAAELISEPLEQLRQDGVLVHYVSAIGSSEGLASRLETDPVTGPEFGTIMVELLSPLDRDRHEDLIIRQVRREIDRRVHQFPGLEYEINEIEEGPPGGYKVAVRFSGDDLDLLGQAGDDLTTRLENIDGTLDVGSDYRDENPEIALDPHADVMGFYDIDAAQVAQAVNTVVTGDTAIQLSLGDEDVTLRLQADRRYQQGAEELRRLKVQAPGGQRVPLGELMDLERGVGLYSVNRRDRDRAVVARSNVVDGVLPDEVFDQLRETSLPEMGFRAVEPEPHGLGKLLRSIGISPPAPKATVFMGQPGTPYEGIRATFTGENEERDENFGYLLRCMLIAVILIFGILVFQFNSYRQAIVVMCSVPISFVGVIGGLWACNFPFSLAAFIGLVSLTGVVVNDAIVMVDFINQGRARGLPVRAAILEAGINRFRAVLLTTATTIGGLLPLMLNLTGGAEFWQPLTAAIIFGLAFATVLTLIAVPVGYSLVYPLASGRKAAAKSPAAQHSQPSAAGS